jgi:hypothetical protein
MRDELKDVLDGNERTFRNKEMQDAASALIDSEQHAKGREHFTFQRMLPARMAAALELLTADLSTDALVATLAFLTGLTGLLRIGTYVQSQVGYWVPMNLFFVSIARTGRLKTPLIKRLLKHPAQELIKENRAAYAREMETYRERLKQAKKNKDTEPEHPQRTVIHASDWNGASLARMLMSHDQKGLGLLLIRDEMSGIFLAINADTQRGTGTAEAQFLECFDGSGFTSLRVGEGVREFDASHVSLYGNIQPEKLAELIGDEDDTGHWARCLMASLPNREIHFRDHELSEDDQQRFDQAQLLLQRYAKQAFTLPPATYELTYEARVMFHRWAEDKLRRAGMPTINPVVAAMLAKAPGHGLRVAGALHLAKLVDRKGREVPISLKSISTEVMLLAMEIVDQLMAETAEFHDQPRNQITDFLRHIQRLGQHNQGVAWQKCRQEGGRWVRKLRVADFKAGVDQLVRMGFGEVIQDSPLTYKAVREMP